MILTNDSGTKLKCKLLFYLECYNPHLSPFTPAPLWPHADCIKYFPALLESSQRGKRAREGRNEDGVACQGYCRPT